MIKTRLSNRTILTIAIVAFMITLITANIRTVCASSTYADGSCDSGHSNGYCAAYKIAYNIEYYWTSLVQDPR
ncbi:MAG TPA: hypothetical protein VKA95_05445 [Nitrososphaeraceae archaeon]|nr:hypothetical protein [Nitrososphaeraceae archaeon]